MSRGQLLAGRGCMLNTPSATRKQRVAIWSSGVTAEIHRIKSEDSGHLAKELYILVMTSLHVCVEGLYVFLYVHTCVHLGRC